MSTSSQPVAVLQPSDTKTALALAEALDPTAQNTKLNTDTLNSSSSPTSRSSEESEEDISKYIWYLAYGSNLNSKVFRGRRQIRPHAARAVLAQGIQLAFDLPGVPYLEPRFANCRVLLPPPAEDIKAEGKVGEKEGVVRKDAKAGAPEEVARVGADADANDDETEKKKGEEEEEEELTALVTRLHHGCWTGEERAMVGVAYLVSPHDFARILATEGGGASYRMVAVDARVLRTTPGPRTQQRNETKERNRKASLSGSKSEEGGLTPAQNEKKEKKVDKRKVLTGEVIRAFTLVAPPEKTRPVPGQPSQRYLNLIREGAKEHNLPTPYQTYLSHLRPYRTRTYLQLAGRALIFAIFAPPLLALLGVGAALPSISNKNKDKDKDKRGLAPRWLIRAREGVFRAMWGSYDAVWRWRFGSGEVDVGGESEGEGDEEGGDEKGE